jgi:16S rRNA (uracil1498-N3)-methyltransferase
MQFVYEPKAKEKILIIEGENYKYLFRVRRHKVGDILEFRNLEDNKLYSYKVVNVSKKEATLELLFAEEKIVMPSKKLILGWCIIDPKTVEKALPSLNEIGVEKIVFIKCAYSQANFKIKKEKLTKILINSSQQCGRSSLMQLEFANSLADFLNRYPNSYLLNFSQNSLEANKNDINEIVIGCEGGLSKDEIALFESQKIVGFHTPLILKSESAAIGASSKIIL